MLCKFHYLLYLLYSQTVCWTQFTCHNLYINVLDVDTQLLCSMHIGYVIMSCASTNMNISLQFYTETVKINEA